MQSYPVDPVSFWPQSFDLALTVPQLPQIAGSFLRGDP